MLEENPFAPIADRLEQFVDKAEGVVDQKVLDDICKSCHIIRRIAEVPYEGGYFSCDSLDALVDCLDIAIK